MQGKDLRTTLLIRPDQKKFMDNYKDSNGVSLTYFVKLAIDERIEKIKKQEVEK